MRPLAKALLMIEVCFCFGPAFLTLLLGLMYGPWILHPGEWLLCAAGVVGIVALVIVLRKIFRPGARAPRPVVPMFMIGCGVAALGFFAISSFENGISRGEFFLSYLPLLCTIHVVYLARHYLFMSRLI